VRSRGVAYLCERALREAPATGVHASALPGLWFNRFDGPFPPKRVSARGVTLALVLQGRKRVTFGRETLAYGPGSYLLITGEQRYSATVSEASPALPYLSMAIDMPPQEVANALIALSDAGDRSGGRADPAAVVAELDAALIDALCRLVATLDDPVERRVLAPLALREIVFRMLRSDAAAAMRRVAGSDDQRIRRALGYMTDHATRRLTVSEIARQVAMSPSHFAHRFREIVRVSPMRYLKHVRLQQARVLMLRDRLGATEVAGQVGYASPSQFTRDFKTYFGAPPATYTQRFREGV
jgi:AraC-like DNA-binding protein